jgi:hypothetical protein
LQRASAPHASYTQPYNRHAATPHPKHVFLPAAARGCACWRMAQSLHPRYRELGKQDSRPMMYYALVFLVVALIAGVL